MGVMTKQISLLSENLRGLDNMELKNVKTSYWTQMNNTNIIKDGQDIRSSGRELALPVPLVTLVTFLVNVRWLHFNSKF